MNHIHVTDERLYAIEELQTLHAVETIHDVMTTIRMMVVEEGVDELAVARTLGQEVVTK